MTGWLPSPVEDLFGADAAADESYDLLTVDVPPSSWIAALETARTTLGCTYFDWLSAVDEPGTGFLVSAHVVALAPVRRLLIRTTVPHDAPVLPTAVGVYAGAAWHERETHEMFGVAFEGHPHLVPLLLPDTFEGHPLRKDFVLAARVAKAWPGAKEPGESEHGGPKRRQMLPPGVPDPNEWGPLKGQLPAAPARPARGAARAAGDRPARRTRTAGEGSASQAAAAPAEAPAPRRARSVSQGSASQRPQAEQPPEPEPKPGPGPGGTAEAAAPEPKPGTPRTSEARREASAPETKPDAPARETKREASAEGGAPAPEAKPGASAPSSDAPWHHARPAFAPAKETTTSEPASTPEPDLAPKSASAPEPAPAPDLDLDLDTTAAKPAGPEADPVRPDGDVTEPAPAEPDADAAKPDTGAARPEADPAEPEAEPAEPTPAKPGAAPTTPTTPHDEDRPGGPE